MNVRKDIISKLNEGLKNARKFATEHGASYPNIYSYSTPRASHYIFDSGDYYAYNTEYYDGTKAHTRIYKVSKYETYRTATGWNIRTRDTRYTEREVWLYVSKVHRDNTYSFTMDYAYAKDFSEKTAKKHLAILNNNQIKPLSLQ